MGEQSKFKRYYDIHEMELLEEEVDSMISMGKDVTDGNKMGVNKVNERENYSV